jgi:hypothetical protein
MPRRSGVLSLLFRLLSINRYSWASRPFNAAFIIILSASIFAAPAAASVPIDAAPERVIISSDWNAKEIMRPRLFPLDGERYEAIGNPNLIQEIYTGGGASGALRVMLVCGGGEDAAVFRNVRLVSMLDDKKEPRAKLLRQVRFGSCDFAHMDTQPNTPDEGRGKRRDVMIRLMRGGVTEAYVYSVSGAGELAETLRINAAFPDRMGVKLAGKLKAGGDVEVVSGAPEKKRIVDLKEAMDILVEDGLYQENGNPVPQMTNLGCVRNGWEGESMRGGDILVGLSLVTESRENVIEVTAVCVKNKRGKWVISDYTFEPFMPYKD